MSRQIISSELFVTLSNEQLFTEFTPKEAAIIKGGGWTSPTFIEGRGVTNCDAARIDSDVRGACQQLANTTRQQLKDVRWYNATRDDSQDWRGRNSCVYRATYECLLE